ncbi:putative glucose-6-phosphate 1-epimerase [Galendromus occidentalis]|uniref:Glucose-6-phosphate 1-epimerase n=1 Tax=Galendromus occidentalis TaxID=34638 RepID=A0AAJ7L7W6_9ACAR|nr:putative glucose-6-phosphate 1-epimerase [Galendromus occidentalis]
MDYIDKTDNFATKTETRKLVSIDKFTDYVYSSTPSDHVLDDGKKNIRIWKSDTLPNTVVWNPKNIWDRFGLAQDEDKEYVCVEPGKVTDKVNLVPGAGWRCSMVLSAARA